MTRKTETMMVGIHEERVVLVIDGTLFLMTPAAARVYADLMVHAADWIDPVVAEPLEGRD